ncbi:MAG: efflux RND transporter periplasmic adaptor subunit, partial [Chloroflexia bacterium]
AHYENIYWQNRELEQRLEKIGEELPDENRDAEAQAWRAVENAQAAMEQARLSYEQALQRQQTSLRSAQDQVDSARANLQRLLSGATTAEIAALKAAVAQAQASYDLAVAQLEKATLEAPFSGVVGTVLARRYDRVAPGTPILVLLDPSTFFVDVEVDEADIGQIAPGEEAEVRLDALPEALLSGRVVEVALFPTTAQGVITYRVRVQLDRVEDAAVRPGMTANVRIITRRASGVLVVPRRAVRLEGGEATVERLSSDGRLERVPVQLGIGDSLRVEIVSGLSEGDRIFVRGVVQRNQIQQILESGGERSRPVQP